MTKQKILLGRWLKEGEKFTYNGKEMFCYPAEFSGNLKCSICGKDFYCQDMWAVNQKILEEQKLEAKCEACSEKDKTTSKIVDMVECGDTIIGIVEEEQIGA